MPRPREPSCCLCQLVYPAIIQSAFGLFSCKTLADDSEMFNLAPHLDCKSDEALVGRAVAAASLGIWGVGFPLFLGTLIHRFAGNPKYSFTIVSYGLQVEPSLLGGVGVPEEVRDPAHHHLPAQNSGTGHHHSASLPLLRNAHICPIRAVHRLSHQQGASCVRLSDLLCASCRLAVDLRRSEMARGGRDPVHLRCKLCSVPFRWTRCHLVGRDWEYLPQRRSEACALGQLRDKQPRERGCSGQEAIASCGKEAIEIYELLSGNRARARDCEC